MTPSSAEDRAGPVGTVLNVQRWLARGLGGLVTVTEWFAYALLVFLVVVLSLQVLFRYVLQLPLSWSEEAARFALVWLSMTAGAIAVYRADHFVFRWATNFLPRPARFVLRRLVDLIVIATLAVILVKSWEYLYVVANRTATGTGLNLRVPYFAVTYGAGLMLLIYLIELLDVALSRITGRVYSLRELGETGPDEPAAPVSPASGEGA